MSKYAIARLSALVMLAALAVTFTISAHAATPSGCTNPVGAPPVAGFVLNTCEHKDWSSLEVNLPAGSKTIQGHFTSVDYRWPGDTAPSAGDVEQYYVKAAAAIGAKRVSDPGDDSNAVFTRKTAQGEFWYIYQGSGDSVAWYDLTTVEIAPPQQFVVARPITASLDTQTGTCKNPPWLVRQFAWYKLDNCSNRDFDAVKVKLPQGEKTLAGRVMEANYTLTDDSKDMVGLALYDNYVHALRKIGAQLVSDPSDDSNVVFTQKTALGKFWYIVQIGGNGDSTPWYTVTTVQVGGPPPKTCTIEVYGVHFDFDKATLRPDSTPVLKQVLAMLQDDPTLQFEIGGHTDNVGTAAHNLTLSDQRASAVENWLVTHGIEASRLTAQGYGETRPLVPNTSPQNRAKNRRVELKRRNCTTEKQ